MLRLADSCLRFYKRLADKWPGKQPLDFEVCYLMCYNKLTPAVVLVCTDDAMWLLKKWPRKQTLVLIERG
jgi:hypothetical protein